MEFLLVLSDVALIKINYVSADFWLIRRGSKSECGKPVRQFNQEHYGIKVIKKDILLPDYLFYCLEDIHSAGKRERLATGTTNLVNIRIEDVRQIELIQV